MVSPTVFIVEDDADTREMLCSFLELEGYQVESASNGKLALERLDAGTPACVIVLDLMMPVMDGWHFRREQVQRAALANIPVIVVSAAGPDRLGPLDAQAVLSKPVNLDELLAQVDSLLPPVKPDGPTFKYYRSAMRIGWLELRAVAAAIALVCSC